MGTEKQQSKLEEATERVAEWVGSTTSIIVHTFVFILIFSTYFIGVSFSNILLVLTTVVSLEAIYLSIFVQMTVNRHSRHLKKHSEHLEQIDKKVV